MTRTTEMLLYARSLGKLNEMMLKKVCDRYDLSLIEANILSFLYFNPGLDTAGDIVELRMLSKGNVSSAVESLIQKGLLKRLPDLRDRRKIHLQLLPKAQIISEELAAGRSQLDEAIFAGFSEEEMNQFERFNKRVFENAKEAMKRSGLK